MRDFITWFATRVIQKISRITNGDRQKAPQLDVRGAIESHPKTHDDEVWLMVLEADLARIDWSSTSHAYGPATDLPEYLRGLASANAKTQDWALEKLSWTIYHQGSVWPAAVETVRFLAELLRCPQVKRKQPVLEILRLLAGGAVGHKIMASFSKQCRRKRR